VHKTEFDDKTIVSLYNVLNLVLNQACWETKTFLS